MNYGWEQSAYRSCAHRQRAHVIFCTGLAVTQMPPTTERCLVRSGTQYTWPETAALFDTFICFSVDLFVSLYALQYSVARVIEVLYISYFMRPVARG